MMSPASSNPVLTEKNHPTIMRLYGRDDAQGAFVGPWIAEKYKGKKVAVLNDKSAYGKGLADVVAETMNKAGLKPVINEGINPGEKDYSAIVSKMKAAGVEFAYFGGYHTEAGLMLRQAADQGYKLNLMTGDSIATNEFWQVSGPAGEGTLFTFPTDPRRSPIRRQSARAIQGAEVRSGRLHPVQLRRRPSNRRGRQARRRRRSEEGRQGAGEWRGGPDGARRGQVRHQG